MKKVFCLIFMFICMLCINVYASAEEVITTFTQETTIKDDLENLGLNYDNYKIVTSDESYDKTNVVAIAEATNQTGLYIYTYNPVVTSKTIVEKVTISYNDKKNNTFECSNISNIFGIRKYYVTCQLPTNDTRKYKIGNLSLKTNLNTKLEFDGFESTFTGTNKVEVNYNTYLLLNDFQAYRIAFRTSFNWSIDYFHDVFFKENPSYFFFYNFNSPISFDDILEVDFTYTMIKSCVRPGSSWNDFIGKLMATNPTDEQIISKDTYDVEHPQTIYRYNKDGSINSYIYSKFGSNIKMDYICMDAKERFSTNDMENIVLEAAGFTDYQYSILFDIRDYDLSSFQVHTNQYGNKINGYLTHDIEDKVSMTRIKYVVDGVTYNARVNDADGSEVEDGTITDNPSSGMAWWLVAFLIILGVIVGVIVITKLVGAGIGGLIKLLWWLVSTPFIHLWKLLKWLAKKIAIFVNWFITTAIPAVATNIVRFFVWTGKLFFKAIYYLIVILTYPFKLIINIISGLFSKNE